VSYTDSNGNLSLETDVANVASKTSTFNIKSGGATFQIGKNVVADQQLKFGLTSANTSNLGGASGNLNDLLGLDYTNATDVKKASAIVDEAIDGINKQRGQIGFMQGSVLKPTTEYLEDNLTAVAAAEGNISNVDVAFESSRLAREELLANNAMNAVLFNRSYAQFLVSSLW
ncbi:MAG: hypothetical protein LBN39_01145, partial [Planctomycetaceae bacterium]|nr:hypothetical protein [Planctomycetaceae bacterium]